MQTQQRTAAPRSTNANTEVQAFKHCLGNLENVTLRKYFALSSSQKADSGQGPGPRASGSGEGKGEARIDSTTGALAPAPATSGISPPPPAVSTLPFHLPCASFAYTMHMQHLVIEVLDFLEPLPVGADDERIADSEEGL